MSALHGRGHGAESSQELYASSEPRLSSAPAGGFSHDARPAA
jgi:hypothetical protein